MPYRRGMPCRLRDLALAVGVAAFQVAATFGAGHHQHPTRGYDVYGGILLAAAGLVLGVLPTVAVGHPDRRLRRHADVLVDRLPAWADLPRPRHRIRERHLDRPPPRGDRGGAGGGGRLPVAGPGLRARARHRRGRPDRRRDLAGRPDHVLRAGAGPPHPTGRDHPPACGRGPAPGRRGAAADRPRAARRAGPQHLADQRAVGRGPAPHGRAARAGPGRARGDQPRQQGGARRAAPRARRAARRPRVGAALPGRARRARRRWSSGRGRPACASASSARAIPARSRRPSTWRRSGSCRRPSPTRCATPVPASRPAWCAWATSPTP